MKKAPLLCAIFLVWVILTILALAGRGRAYRKYAEDFGRHPLVSVVMRGIHDHVMPWSEGSPEDETMAVAAADESAEGQVPAASEQENTDENGEAENELQPGQVNEQGADQSGQAADGNAASGQDANGGDKAQDKAESGTDDKKAAGTDDKGENGARDKGEAGSEGTEEKKDQPQDPDANPDAKEGADQKEQEPSVRTEQSEQAAGDLNKSMTVPGTSCSRVVPARDYGVAQDRYLSPKGTEFNKDTEGLFAPNGIYYSLQNVDDKYFSDALFIGDSRTVGLFDYGGMETFTSFMARESTTVYDLFDDNEKMFYTPLGKKTTERTLKDLLSKAKFRKIYVSVGVNELGIPDTMDYYQEFRKVVTRINKLQPEAIIYIQGIMHVSKAMSRKDPVFNNTAIVQRNQAISTLANGRNIFYIDMNADLCDNDGNLKDELTGDGIHLKASACTLWYKFLKTHAIVIPD